MAISLKKLLISIATDAVEAQQSVKLESASFFEALFETTKEGQHKPAEFMLGLLKHDVGLPLMNMIDQDIFPVKEMEVGFETDASLSTDEKGQVFVDCTLKNGLQKNNAKLSIKMKLKSKESTEGIEQLRAYLADRLSDGLQVAKQERKADAKAS